jgi:hypothetical protein
MRVVILVLIATSAQAQGYFSRFLSHSVVDVNNGIQYRYSTSTVDLEQYFDAKINQSDIHDVENQIGFNIPIGVENILMDINPLTGVRTQSFRGFEITKSVTLGIPYAQASIQWGKGRMEQPSIYSAKSIGLIADLLTDRSHLLEELAIAALKEEASKPLISGRVDLRVELNMYNIISPSLKSSPYKKWRISGNVYPYWVTSLDASNNVGLVSPNASEMVNAELSKLHIPFADDITSMATSIINSKLFLPTNPFYNGFGIKTLLQVKYKKAIQFGWLVDYSEIKNGQRGVSPIKSLASSINIRFGL